MKNKSKLILYILWICLIMIIQEDPDKPSSDSSLSIYLYFMPVWITVISFIAKQLFDRTKPMAKVFFNILYLYVIVFIVQTVVVAFFTTTDFLGPFYWNIVKFITPLACIIWISGLSIDVTKKQLHFSVDFFFYCTIIALLPKMTHFEVSDLSFQSIVLDGNLPTESDTLCFVFGFIAAYYICQRDIIKMIAATFFVILTCKRIVLLGLILVVFLNIGFVKQLFIKYFYAIIILVILANFGYVYILYSIGGQTESVVHKIENTSGETLNKLTMGRQKLYQRIVEKLKRPKVYGNGVGKVIYTMRSISKTEEWLHSDIFMNIYEVGMLGTAIWLFLLYYWFKDDGRLLSVVALFNVYLLTDNTFYYFVPSFLFYYVIYVIKRTEALKGNKHIIFIKTEDIEKALGTGETPNDIATS